ncbi:putative protein MIZU-KUSSEI 1-like, plant [Helianthus anomalus]
MNHRLLSLPRTSSCKSTTPIIPSNYISSTSFLLDPTDVDKPLAQRDLPVLGCGPRFFTSGSFIRTILNMISVPSIFPSCRWLSLPGQLPGRKVTGTLFGNRRGHVSFAVQNDPRSYPIIVVQLAVTTANLVKEMSSGLVRIALECEKQHVRGGRGGHTKLYNEATWSMYCNGRKCGYALTRACTESDWHVLSTVQTVSVGAGVIPVVEDGGKRKGEGEGELLYMRARFERVVGSRDSEAFYMMNPDGSRGPELSIFLLRI